METPITEFDLIPELNALMRDQINDEQLERLLAEAQHDGQAPNRITLLQDALTRFKSQVSAARNCLIFPDQESPSRARLAKCYHPSYEQVVVDAPAPPAGNNDPSLSSPAIYESWRALINDACHLTLAIAQVYFARPGTPEEQARRAIQIVDALRQLLLCRMCAMRANINQNVWVEDPTWVQRFGAPTVAVARLREACEEYDRQIRQWDLHRILRRGEKEAADAIAYNSWRSDFGQPHDRELGWGPFARVTRLELRCLRYSMEFAAWRKALWPIPRNTPDSRMAALKEYLVRRPTHALRSAASSVVLPFWGLFTVWFTMVTRLAQRPGAFTSSVLLTIFTFSALYFVDDFVLGRCAGNLSLLDYGKALYYAVVNFTNLGSSSACGPLSGALISSESLIGYFLLSVLAAMIFTWFVDR